MSTTSKRLHEGSDSPSLKQPLEEASIVSSHGKLGQSACNDFLLSYKSAQDGRLAKVQRIEPCDIDKRAPLLHRMDSPSNCLDYSITAENRLESRDTKDVKDAKAENRETKGELRELYSEIRIDLQGEKLDKNTRYDNRSGREIRPDRAPHNGLRGDKKIEVDSHAVEYSHLNWKESKEYYKGRRTFEPTNGLDSWHIAQHGLQNTNIVAKNISASEVQSSLETHEAVEDNKVDMKAEEKLIEKDKRCNDSEEKDKDRSDHQIALQVDCAFNTCKEPVREEKESEKLNMERSEEQKDKEHNDKKYPNKAKLSNANEKENSQYEKAPMDGLVAVSKKETTSQPSQHKDESSRASDSDLKDKGRGANVDVGDNNEKYEKCYDKESDDGCEDGNGVTERIGQVSGNDLQQHRRMLQSRGISQSPHRDPRFRSRERDIEGSQGQLEECSIVYKPGVCIQELLKSWREFEASQDSKNDERFKNSPTFDIQIPAHYVTSTNHQVRGAQIWGTDIYTHDSDLVAVLMHTGYWHPTLSLLPSIQELQVTVQVLPPQDCYVSTFRNNVRSRAWGAGIGCSFHVVQCCIVKKGGGTIDLEPRAAHISTVEPTLSPVPVERTMTTRAAASNALHQHRFVHEVTVQYSLCNEPWLKYSVSIVADKGLTKPLYTATRLKKGEVLYLETHLNRYELCFSGERAVCSIYSDQKKLQNHSSHVANGKRSLRNRDNIINVFRWSRCKKPLPHSIMRSIGIPLPAEYLEVLAENLDWEDVQWSRTGVWITGKEYVLARVHFLSRT